MQKQNAAKVVIKQDPIAPVEKEVLAQAIVRISECFIALRKNGLKKEAVIVLVARSSAQSMNTVKRVLDSLETLRQDYTTL